MAKTKPQRIKVADVAEALRHTAGIYTQAALILARKYGSCSPNTVKAYVQRHKVLQDLQVEILDQTLDVAESKLITAITEGELKAVFFYLKTKGKHRGYTERVESTGADGGPMETVTRVDLSDLTAEERDALRQILERRAGEAGGSAQRA